ncbi:MAG: DUF4180 domain-containing protein [Treponema sp.]|jgi:indolepyruvate ferredoxin oxidoreductase beta subunit|nr:DUF4180 domain-containing protein [Treponema sp.]
MKKNCLITGVGGQGTVLLSRLIGRAALEQGLAVRGTETIGMAQRGGSVVSHIRMGTGIHSPLIPLGRADLIIAFECAEAVRVLPFLAPEGRMILLDRPIPPVSSSLGAYRYDPAALLNYLRARVKALTRIDGAELIHQCGNPRVVNVALLGVALTLDSFPFTAEDIIRIMTAQLPPHYLELNLKALRIGLSTQGSEGAGMTYQEYGNGIIAVFDAGIQTIDDFCSLFLHPTCSALLIPKEQIPADFYDLSSGFAGAVLQKCSNYHKKLAIIGDFSDITSGAFKDFMYESNQHKQILFVHSAEEALAVLR